MTLAALLALATLACSTSTDPASATRSYRMGFSHFLAMETNLVRAVAPAALYANLRAIANGAASALESRGTTTKLFASVQVEAAWGKMPGMSGYVGLAQDRADAR